MNLRGDERNSFVFAFRLAPKSVRRRNGTAKDEKATRNVCSAPGPRPFDTAQLRLHSRSQLRGI